MLNRQFGGAREDTINEVMGCFLQYQIKRQNLTEMMGTQLLGYNLMQYKNYDHQNAKMIKTVEKMYLSHFNLDVNFLQDEINLHEDAQFLKRFYEEYQYGNKIIMLSQYYQYHQELPRIFQQNVTHVIENYYEDIRNLEYKYVTKKMKQEPQTDRLSHRPQPLKPADKLIKNIQLSYYNFENKNNKKVQKDSSKEKQQKNHANNKNKKSMPSLITQPYRSQSKMQDHPKTTNCRPAIPPHPHAKSKETSKMGMKTKSKELLNKCSLNNSVDSRKNLSRSKSKSNIIALLPQHPLKRNSVSRPLQQINLNKNEKAKSNPSSLQKTGSVKLLLKKQQGKRVGKGQLESVDKKLNSGMKNMFKKVMQTKKLIKLTK